MGTPVIKHPPTSGNGRGKDPVFSSISHLSGHCSKDRAVLCYAHRGHTPQNTPPSLHKISSKVSHTRSLQTLRSLHSQLLDARLWYGGSSGGGVGDGGTLYAWYGGSSAKDGGTSYAWSGNGWPMWHIGPFGLYSPQCGMTLLIHHGPSFGHSITTQ